MKEDIFTQVGKRTPYRVPEGYMDLQKERLKEAVSNQPSAVRPLRRAWYYGIAAAVVSLLAVYPVMRLVSPSTDAPAPSIYADSSIYDDSGDWSDFADADIFLDEFE